MNERLQYRHTCVSTRGRRWFLWAPGTHFCALILLCTLPGCGPQTAASSTKTTPAKIEHPDEGDIYRIVLTPKAEQRLQISTAPVEKRAVPRSRTVGGEVSIRDGASVLVTAPLTGTLLKSPDQTSSQAGRSVASGQAIFHLLPLLAPEREVPSAAERVAMANAKASLLSSQIIADGDVQQSQAQVEAAEIALSRAKRLLADRAGSRRDVDDAQARFDIASTALQAAQARKELLDKLTLAAQAGQVAAVPIPAPQQGILRNVSSAFGQMVSVGAPLFEVVGLDTVWVRVPVYPGLRNHIDQQSNALVRRLGGDESHVSVKPIAAPPSANPIAVTVDLYYELPNSDGRFRPGERVEVTLPLIGETESAVVPRAAVLRDIHGIAWVYVNSAEHEFRRHRIEVHFTTSDSAILSQAPDIGTLVVVDGAAELFGTEFGAGK